MTAEEFLDSLQRSDPPADLSGPLLGLWHSARGEWDRAHGLVQDDPSTDAAWVHAHLHRIEGDLGNAGYWYNCAGRRPSDAAIEEERVEIATTLLAR